MKVLIQDNLSKKILIWYDKNKRELPWRKSKKNLDPYQTWISEIMLQQTTVEAVIPFFHKFIINIKKLASFWNQFKKKRSGRDNQGLIFRSKGWVRSSSTKCLMKQDQSDLSTLI